MQRSVLFVTVVLTLAASAAAVEVAPLLEAPSIEEGLQLFSTDFDDIVFADEDDEAQSVSDDLDVFPSDVDTDLEEGEGVTGQMQATLLKWHNDKRREVVPTASNMVALEWDTKLAAVAQAYASNCRYAHNSQRHTQYGSKAGENIAAWTSHSAPITSGPDMWFDERANFNFKQNKCGPNQVCGHYTQVAWATSTKLGCGFKRCPTLFGPGWKDANILVCNYSPPGNFVGRIPYLEGTPCSKCPMGTRCDGTRLCSKNGTGKVGTTTPTKPTTPTKKKPSKKKKGGRGCKKVWRNKNGRCMVKNNCGKTVKVFLQCIGVNNRKGVNRLRKHVLFKDNETTDMASYCKKCRLK